MNISEKIKSLRQSKNYSLQQLADLSGLSKPAIQQYEDGTIKPSSKALQAIASALEVGVFFFFSTLQKELQLKDFRYRELVNQDGERKIIYDSILPYAQNYIELEDILNERIVCDDPVDDVIVNDFEDVEKAAKKLRKKWKLGEQPIDDVTSLLESKGFKILTVNRPTGSPGLCGSLKDDKGTIPFIIINDNTEHLKEICRRRFTIVHELAHCILRFGAEVDKKLEEQLCNRFAAAFLLPDEVLISIIGKDRTIISLVELKQIKEKYGVSIQSIIYNSHSARLISNETKERWLETYNVWRDDPANKFGEYSKSNEQPKRFSTLLIKALAEQRITEEKAAELTGLHLDEVVKLYTGKTLNL